VLHSLLHRVMYPNTHRNGIKKRRICKVTSRVAYWIRSCEKSPELKPCTGSLDAQARRPSNSHRVIKLQAPRDSDPATPLCHDVYLQYISTTSCGVYPQRTCHSLPNSIFAAKIPSTVFHQDSGHIPPVPYSNILGCTLTPSTRQFLPIWVPSIRAPHQI
jgi:hypothetical protein